MLLEDCLVNRCSLNIRSGKFPYAPADALRQGAEKGQALLHVYHIFQCDLDILKFCLQPRISLGI